MQSFLAGGLPLQAESRACAAPCADSFAYIMHVYSYGSSCGRVQRASLEGGVALLLPLLRAMKERERERETLTGRFVESARRFGRMMRIPIDNNGEYEGSYQLLSLIFRLFKKFEIQNWKF